MPEPSTPNPNLHLATGCQHAAEALSALRGCVDNGEPSSPALRRAADTAVLRMLTIARNLRAAIAAICEPSGLHEPRGDSLSLLMPRRMFI